MYIFMERAFDKTTLYSKLIFEWVKNQTTALSTPPPAVLILTGAVPNSLWIKNMHFMKKTLYILHALNSWLNFGSPIHANMVVITPPENVYACSIRKSNLTGKLRAQKEESWAVLFLFLSSLQNTDMKLCIHFFSIWNDFTSKPIIFLLRNIFYVGFEEINISVTNMLCLFYFIKLNWIIWDYPS